MCFFLPIILTPTFHILINSVQCTLVQHESEQYIRTTVHHKLYIISHRIITSDFQTYNNNNPVPSGRFWLMVTLFGLRQVENTQRWFVVPLVDESPGTVQLAQQHTGRFYTEEAQSGESNSQPLVLQTYTYPTEIIHPPCRLRFP